MQLKNNLEDFYVEDFWYDLTDGGYFKPEDVLENEVDIIKVKNAIDTLYEFYRSCVDNIPNFEV